jgi:hypothetical protein
MVSGKLNGSFEASMIANQENWSPNRILIEYIGVRDSTSQAFIRVA